MAQIEGVFRSFVEMSVMLLELVGVVILLITTIKCIVGLLRRSNHVRLQLAEGIALALEFKLGGEVLRTVIAREWGELLILGAIIVLRAALTFLIHWEIQMEETRLSGNTRGHDKPED
ncbi:MAG: DUF1622 domain-containing protein [Oscillospiraceae bacterium]|nr:DUF1622 domain-containing protein [Oscillospiraceae bacterium]